MTDRTITIAVGVVKWSYHIAATLHACTVTRTDGIWALAGQAVSADTFRLSQRPLVFQVMTKGGLWKWPIEELQYADGVLTARLGPRE